MASRPALIALLAVVSCAAVASAATTFTVGDTSGWALGVNYDNWVSGKTFAEGDMLVFSYSTGSHDVLEVSKSDYDACNLGKALTTNTNGPTTITLTAGDHYYVCGIGTHCNSGMKLAVSVGSGSGGSPSPSTPSTPSSPPSSSTPAAPAPKNAASASHTAGHAALAMAAGVLLKLALF